MIFPLPRSKCSANGGEQWQHICTMGRQREGRRFKMSTRSGLLHLRSFISRVRGGGEQLGKGLGCAGVAVATEAYRLRPCCLHSGPVFYCLSLPERLPAGPPSSSLFMAARVNMPVQIAITQGPGQALTPHPLT